MLDSSNDRQLKIPLCNKIVRVKATMFTGMIEDYSLCLHRSSAAQGGVRVQGLVARPGGSMAHVCWLVGCLTSQQHVSESQGRICLTASNMLVYLTNGSA